MISPSFNSCLMVCPRETLRASLECYFMQKLQASLASWSPYVVVITIVKAASPLCLVTCEDNVRMRVT